MERKDFIKTCGISCVGFAALALGLTACASVYSVQGTVTKNVISFPKQAFTEIKKSGEKLERLVVVVNVEGLKFPVAVYDNGNDHYTALWLKCSHQGNEVSVHGDLLSCSAHGSEYDKYGKVIKGPAKEALRQFTVRAEGINILIDLA
ncbi:Rieske Fe-S protein [Dyadobacter sp. BE34]|uniref:Rieske Fe-S protein n=1 Tax=Dyadobacter fermentans TaxID=94254 RepID=A0ABU1R8P1_9BACT|nr:MULTISPECIES: Rieske 2Fe-2S domain-containing protein [Dyadobacter]MDR6809786.1 Rieske Fe-S protein [Dyadobacter fermentans]MDR7047499.1 Rieske Fe-S protein [Dyadobacter sp. BE242]MDR7201669.1 Rieske Fe-S protein [Dyadobacter sp. BE34]MDR7219539.1 Rieske Fe-S protein [Dyadobacter sp. BE31]MDR7267338.1 Rieske Fe-S protein [Dyadobacter sp. BE32]